MTDIHNDLSEKKPSNQKLAFHTTFNSPSNKTEKFKEHSLKIGTLLLNLL